MSLPQPWPFNSGNSFNDIILLPVLAPFSQDLTCPPKSATYPESKFAASNSQIIPYVSGSFSLSPYQIQVTAPRSTIHSSYYLSWSSAFFLSLFCLLSCPLRGHTNYFVCFFFPFVISLHVSFIPLPLSCFIKLAWHNFNPG